MESNPVSEINADPEEKAMPEESAGLTALNAGIRAATVGPARVPLIDQGVLNLPKNYLFIPMKEAADFMSAIGNKNSIGPEFLGIVISDQDTSNWFIIIDYIKSGYIKEDDAQNWNKDDLLQSIKNNTKKSNDDRIANGFKPLDIVGWIEPPAYTASNHQLIWSILGKDGSPESVVNYNTYVLGREGYFQLALVTSDATISSENPILRKYLHHLIIIKINVMKISLQARITSLNMG